MQVAEATDFLVKLQPLRHVAPVRKSQVQHAICEMLTAILKENVSNNTPRWAHIMTSYLKPSSMTICLTHSILA